MDKGLKPAIFAQFSRVGKALSNSNRLEILEFLAQGERSVDSLSKASGLTVANTSQHLQQLRQAGMVTSRKAGQQVYYRLNGNDVYDLLNALCGVAKNHLAEIDRLVESCISNVDELDPVPKDELMSLIDNEKVTVIDVRDPEEFATGHLPGAKNIPAMQLDQHIDDLPSDQEVIAYCRGPYCILASAAVLRLRAAGVRARHFHEGFPGWRNDGLPVESAASNG